jgi:hypothetical protein
LLATGEALQLGDVTGEAETELEVGAVALRLPGALREALPLPAALADAIDEACASALVLGDPDKDPAGIELVTLLGEAEGDAPLLEAALTDGASASELDGLALS